MDKIIGTNLGNWLVLEKWMQPFIFKGTGAEALAYDERTQRHLRNRRGFPKHCISRLKHRPHSGTVFYFRRQRTLFRMY